MNPYGSIFYFGFAALYVLLPAVAARAAAAVNPLWLNRAVILGGSLVMLTAQYAGWFDAAGAGSAHPGTWGQLDAVGAYLLLQYALARGHLALRSRLAPGPARWAGRVATLGALLPLVLVKWAGARAGVHLPAGVPPGAGSPAAGAWTDAAGAWLAFTGISYATFRAVDVQVSIQDGLVRRLPPGQFAAFLAFFPTVSAGPVDRWRRFGQDWERPCTGADAWQDLDAALFRIATGFLFKFVGAALVKALWLDRVPLVPGWTHALSYMYAYSLYLYLDFAGYSHFAVGFARLLGVRAPENFRRPFLAADIRDFWTRWHVSLSFWFRDFVYLRLLLAVTRRGWLKNQQAAGYLANLVTFGLMGLWHGTAWNYLAYGCYHALLLTGYDLFARWNRPRRDQPPRWWGQGWGWRLAGVGLTLHAVCFGFLIFSGRFPW